MLEEIPLFSSLSETDIAAIERQAVRKLYRRNTIIIEHGDDANTLYFLVKGRVKVYMLGDDGKEIVFGEREPGSYVGELALLTGGKRSASVQTIEDSEFLILTQESFRRIISEYPDIALRLLQDLAKRACDLSDDVSAFALLDVYGRVAKLLEGNAQDEEGRSITGRLTHQDIADRVGSSREMVSRILKELKFGGYIDIDKKRIVLLKPLPSRW